MVSRLDNLYHKGDIVWAKVKGCSWWPGQIQYQICNNKGNSDSIKEKRYRINFIGHNSYCDVNYLILIPFFLIRYFLFFCFF